jgi:hypothetical protein
VRIGSFFGGGGGSASIKSSSPHLSAAQGVTAAGVAASEVNSPSEAEGGSVVKFALTFDGDSSDFDEASVKTNLTLLYPDPDH